MIRQTLVAFVAGLAFSASSFAVVEAKLPFPKTFNDSTPIVVGVIDKSRPQLNRFSVAIKETIKGIAIESPVLLQVPPELTPLMADGQPVLIMASRRDPRVVIVRVADRWAEATPAAGGAKGYQVVKLREDIEHTYPGPTTSVVELYKLLKDGKKTGLLDRIDPAVLVGGVKSLGQLPVAGATAAVAGDFGDKKLSIAVATAQGTLVFGYDGKAFSPSKLPAPAGFPSAMPKSTDAGKALAVAAGDFSATGQPGTIVIREKGIFREAGEGKAPVAPDDFRRLTGDAVTTYPLGFDKGAAYAAATSIDVNGDGKRDLVVLTETSGVVLLNRGWGAFFVVPKLSQLIAGEKELPFKVAPGLLLAAADLNGDKREELIVIEPDGKVWAVANPAPAEKKE